MAVLVNPTNVTAETTSRAAEATARAMRLHIQVINAGTSGEINAAFAKLGSERPDAVLIGGDGLFNARRAQLVNLASRYTLPTTTRTVFFPTSAG